MRRWRWVLVLLVLAVMLACVGTEGVIVSEESYWAKECTNLDGTTQVLSGRGTVCGPCSPGWWQTGPCVVTTVKVGEHR